MQPITSQRLRVGLPLSRSLIVFGIACLTIYSLFAIRAAVYQRNAKAELDRFAATHLPAPPAPADSEPRVRASVTPIQKGELIGRVDVPRLKLSAAVAEGDDDSTLGKAV